MSRSFSRLIAELAAHPERRLDEIQLSHPEEGKRDTMDKDARKQAKLAQLLATKPKEMSFSGTELVTIRSLDGHEGFPLVFEPAQAGLDLIDWIQDRRELVDRRLAEAGALLFRGFGLEDVSRFEELAELLTDGLYSEYGDLPRETMGRNVYSSTPYPPDKSIPLHNESSQMHCWPLKQLFLCVTPAQERGETPIADCRQVYRELAPELREKFEHKGLLYVRNFIGGIDVDWQEFFHTDDRSEVEDYCRQADIVCEWTERGLRTKKQAPAVARHPRTGDLVFFNQLQAHHIDFLDEETRSSLLSLFGEEYLPRNVYFGDGSAISSAEIDVIRATCEHASVIFPWQRGDVLLLDNMLSAHARNPFVGPRKIVVAMGDMVASDEVEWRGVREGGGSAR